MALKPFRDVGGNHPGYSVFDLSHRKTLTMDMGQLVPVFMQEAVPGDRWQLGNEIVIRMQPLVAPILHKIDAYIHYFFVPYRLLWDDWENFITGGPDGSFNTPIPKKAINNGSTNVIGTLYDYFGFPTGVDLPDDYIIEFPWRAYNKIYNEFYRDENLQTTEVPQDTNVVQLRAWGKDYFTSALPWQQRGTSPALPITGTSAAVWNSGLFYSSAPSAGAMGGSNTAGTQGFYTTTANAMTNIKNTFNNNTVDLSVGVGVDVNDMRLAFQIQRWLELNARAGVRYTEFLQAHYGVSPRDDRLQRPEYIGGMKTPVIISEVLQTSSTDAETPQGNMAGHGITVDREFCGKYRAEEFGVIMGLLSVMPEAMYQDGVNRMWTRDTKYDFYNPAFAHLSEQAITNGEIYAQNIDSTNRAIWGYQGRFDEYRYIPSSVHGQMRTTYDYWHMGRKFTSLPNLNGTFIACDPTKRIFAAPSEPGLIVQIGNRAVAARPMPAIAIPGLIDHV